MSYHLFNKYLIYNFIFHLISKRMRKLIKANRVNSVSYKREKKIEYRGSKSKIGESREIKLL